ncbi:hypothetical protein [Caulobacter sp. CCH5-E12]|jgi:hypothetical protein|uniref:hypothetical protein n=1 Tax=Caulobacter sp. CCH5-E12 TaxID=1768770 RepID=UPI00078212DD|nr:hypothetical protein [Caulobacter sp. CCH5-E12]
MIGAKREAILSAVIDLMNRPDPKVSLVRIKPLDLLGDPSDRQRAVGIGGAPSIALSPITTSSANLSS